MDDFLKKVIKVVFKMLHLRIKETTIESLVQFVKFGIVGLSNTIVGYIANIVTIMILSKNHVSWDYFAGNIVAFILGVIWSFYWNNRFVFKIKDGDKRNLVAALFKTYLSYALTGLVLNNILSYLWVDILGISKMIAPLINMIIGVPINFIINKLWAFKSVRVDK